MAFKLGRNDITVPDEVFEFLLGKLAGEDDFDTTATEIARVHDRFVFFFEGGGKFFVTANLLTRSTRKVRPSLR